MKYIVIKILFVFNVFTIYGQTIVGEYTGHSSAILDINHTNNQSFLPPRVELVELNDSTNPIANPAEGLIVYNIGSNQLSGYYIWENENWNLLATRDNSVSSAIYQGNALQSLSLATPQTLDLFPTEVINTIGMNKNNESFIVPAGKYVVYVVLNVTTNETNTGGIGRGTGTNARYTHAHYYTMKALAGTTTLSEVLINESSAANGNKKHTIIGTLSFELTSESNSFIVQLSRRYGGTYSGAITINNAFIHIEKSLP